MTLVVIPDECQSMPITAPKIWNQKRVCETFQELGTAVLVNNGFSDHPSEGRHADREPGGHVTAMEREIGASGTSVH